MEKLKYMRDGIVTKGKKDHNKPGSKPDHLQIDEENREDAIKKAVQEKIPKDWWPDKNKGY